MLPPAFIKLRWTYLGFQSNTINQDCMILFIAFPKPSISTFSDLNFNISRILSQNQNNKNKYRDMNT